jgi:LemA protein
MNTKCKLNKDFNHILATIENYPTLKANEQFLNLQKSLSKMENQLQAVRRIYNMEVTSYNTKISIFPLNLIATIFNFQKELFFEI